MKNVLVIVESATKEKTISKYLKELYKDANFTVKASAGHICDVVTENFGIDKNTFQPVYKVIPDKSKVVKMLQEHNKKNDLVLLAADNDREGEAIAWHLKNVLKPKNYKRIVFNEITKPALEQAIKNQKDIDMDMVESQKTRRILDRLVGFNLSTILRKSFKYSGTLSAGRVQSVVLGIIVEKEMEINKFETQKYWNVLGSFEYDITDAKLYDEKDVIIKITDESKVKDLLQKDLGLIKEYDVVSKKFKDILDKPDKPFTTSTLQQKASSIGFTIKETMKVAQELYELGHITYMRTDSTNISVPFQYKIVDFIKSQYGENYLNNPSNSSTKKQKNAQEAHEAIRPTNLVRLPGLNKRQVALYDLIFNRTVAYFMVPAKYKELCMKITEKRMNKKYFMGKSKHLVELGYKIVYEDTKKVDNEGIEETFNKLDKLSKIKPTKIVGNCIWTSPPARYSEASIIKKMEDTGIGRPSTYVSIVNILYDRKYVNKTDMKGPEMDYIDYVLVGNVLKKKLEKKELYNQKGSLVPTEIGITISKYLSGKFNDIINTDFTSDMESGLDEISQGKKTYLDTIKKFHKFITDKCNKTVKSKDVIKPELASYKNEFDIKGKKVLIRDARFGPVIEILNPKSFIPLKPYMKLKGISEIKHVKKDDVLFLMKFPIDYKGFTINYKGYGFYVEKNRKSQTIYPQYFDNLLKEDYAFVEKILDKSKKR